MLKSSSKTQLAAVPRRLLPILMSSAAIWIALALVNGWMTGWGTLVVLMGLCLVDQVIPHQGRIRLALAYLCFFVTPFMVAVGLLGVLTGLGSRTASPLWMGLSFVTAGAGAWLASGRRGVWCWISDVGNPARWLSGPCAVPIKTGWRCRGRWWDWRRLRICASWLLLGGLHYAVIAPGLHPLLVLRESDQALDLLIFAAVFEMYVYFNFSGCSFIVAGFLNAIGVRTMINFRSPFSARNVIDYWARWHLSLSAVLKYLFFTPVRAKLGISGAVIATFLASALWHGVSLNFLCWGLFHATAWLLTYCLAGRSRFSRLVSTAMLVPVVLLGRMVFAEPDMQRLGGQLHNLLRWDVGAQTWFGLMRLDFSSGMSLALAGLFVGLEIVAPQWTQNYRWARQPLALVMAFIMMIWLGVWGHGAVYGVR